MPPFIINILLVKYNGKRKEILSKVTSSKTANSCYKLYETVKAGEKDQKKDKALHQFILSSFNDEDKTLDNMINFNTSLKIKNKNNNVGLKKSQIHLKLTNFKKEKVSLKIKEVYLKTKISLNKEQYHLIYKDELFESSSLEIKNEEDYHIYYDTVAQEEVKKKC